MHMIKTLPVLVLIDTSGSMSGISLKRVQVMLEGLKSRIQSSEIIRRNAEICVMGFNERTYRIFRWTKVDELGQMKLCAYGSTDLSNALNDAIDEIGKRQSELTGENKAILLLITDAYGGDLAPDMSEKLQEAGIDLWLCGLPGFDKESAAIIADSNRVFELPSQITDSFDEFYTAVSRSMNSILSLSDEHPASCPVRNDINKTAGKAS